MLFLSSVKIIHSCGEQESGYWEDEMRKDQISSSRYRSPAGGCVGVGGDQGGLNAQEWSLEQHE